MVLDDAGGLLWFKPLPAGARAADLRAQVYEGRPVLSWWQDPLIAGGHSGSGVVIADSSYKQIAVVRAGNGYQPDLHAFEITPRGTALLTVYDAIRCNLHAYGGPADGAVADTLFQEIDLRTGLVRFEWHALDHVPLAASYMPAKPGSPRSPWDFFHINAVSLHGKTILVDSRNTWAAYDVDGASGQVLWSLGGKQSSFAMGPRAAPAWQHDAREGAEGTITFFDNGGTPKVHPQSRAIVVRLDLAQDGDAGLELHARKPAAGRQPGRLPAAHRGRLDGRLGSGTVLLGVQRFGPTAVRCPPAGRLSVLHRSEGAVVSRSRGTTAHSRARRRARRHSCLCVLEWGHRSRTVAPAGRCEPAVAEPRSHGPAPGIRDADRDCGRAPLRRCSGARRTGPSPRDLRRHPRLRAPCSEL